MIPPTRSSAPNALTAAELTKALSEHDADLIRQLKKEEEKLERKTQRHVTDTVGSLQKALDSMTDRLASLEAQNQELQLAAAQARARSPSSARERDDRQRSRSRSRSRDRERAPARSARRSDRFSGSSRSRGNGGRTRAPARAASPPSFSTRRGRQPQDDVVCLHMLLCLDVDIAHSFLTMLCCRKRKMTK